MTIDAVAADVDAADVDDRVVRLRLAADELVGVRDRDDFLDARKVLEHRGIGFAAVAGDADGGAERAGDRMGAEAQPLDVANDGFDLFRPRAGFHDDEHRCFSWDRPRNRARTQRCATASIIERSIRRFRRPLMKKIADARRTPRSRRGAVVRRVHRRPQGRHELRGQGEVDGRQRQGDREARERPVAAARSGADRRGEVGSR